MIDSKNFFIAKLGFGVVSENHVILALDESDAIETIKEYYNDFELYYLISLTYLLELNQKIKSNRNNFNLVIVVKQDNGIIQLSDNIEYGDEKTIKEKYKDNNIFLLNATDVQNIITEVVEKFNNSEVIPLISEKIQLQ